MAVQQDHQLDRQNDTRPHPGHDSNEQGSQTEQSGTHPGGFDYSTHIADIHQATTIKQNQVFLLTNDAGDVLPRDYGYGLYFRDMCYLNQLELRLQGELGVALLADASAGSCGCFELTNPELHLPDGRTLAKERLSIQRAFSLQEDITHSVTIRNLDQVDVALDVTFGYASTFIDMFTIRGAQPGARGTLRAPAVHNGTVTLAYDGADQHTRTTSITFSIEPDELDGGKATYRVQLRPGEHITLTLSCVLEDHAPGPDDEAAGTHTHQTGITKHAAFTTELARVPKIETGHLLFDRALARSLADIQMLATANRDDLYLAAGVPWYVALFGRDSCITAFETLAYHPSLATSTLRLLAQYQGTKVDTFQDEEPGKILHELRVGERANLREVSMIPYYGTVDATPWFVMLLAEYVRWTGDLDLVKELRGNLERALQWMDANEADRVNLPGYLSYGTRSEKGLLNQGWKDSDNGIVNEDGSLCAPPIALVEVQGYLYHARRAAAALFRALGEGDRAAQLEHQADELQQRLNDEFWLGEDTGYVFCLQRNRRPSKAVASNPGQLLFTGVLSDDRALWVADRLMQDDLFCGWGIRTLSAKEKAYNPLDYQTGSVWPHDNALIALGMHRYGLTGPLERIFTGIFQAATHFPEYRLPEVFDGFSDQQFTRPVTYPVACQPQAWAAGTLPLLLQAALGLEPDALHSRLSIHQPYLPSWLPNVTIRGLRVANATVDLQYHRVEQTTMVAMLGRTGELEVSVQY
jgi:glycogen debranching enzyme